jgi:ATP-dependent Zn protease
MTQAPPPLRIDYSGPQYPPPDRRGVKFGMSIFGWVLLIGLAIMLFVMSRQQYVGTTDISLSEFKDSLQAGKIRSVTVSSDELVGDYNSTSGVNRFRVELSAGMGNDWSFVQWLLDNRGETEVKCSNSQNLLLQVILPFVPWVVIFGFVWFFIFRQLRRQSTNRTPMPVVIVNPEQR